MLLPPLHFAARCVPQVLFFPQMYSISPSKITLLLTVEMFLHKFFKVAFDFELVSRVLTAPSQCASQVNFRIIQVTNGIT